MAKSILYCDSCKEYTTKEICSCGQKTAHKKPAKYSPEDKYGKYRREAKRDALKKEGLI